MEEQKKEISVVRYVQIFILIILAVIAVGAIRSGFYIVNPNEIAVVQRFGKYIRQGNEGLNFKLPAPVEKVTLVDVEKVRRLEIGFRTVSENPTRYSTVPQESLMLTGDENIVNIEYIVQYKVADAGNFIFNVKNPRETLKKVSESAMRQEIGDRPIDDGLTDKKSEIQIRTKEIF